MSYLRHINLLKAFPGARMSGTYTVAKSTETSRGTSKKGYPYVAYDLVFETGEIVNFSQSPQKPPPSVGETKEGSIEEKWGKMCFVAERVDSQQATTGTAGPPSGPPAPFRSDTTQKSIVRQHSQQMALMYVQSRVILDKASDLSVALVKSLTDWFQEDAEGKDPAPRIP